MRGPIKLHFNLFVLFTLFFVSPSFAQQKGQWVPGQMGLNAGITPDPGITYGNITINYSASQLNDASGNALKGITGTYSFWVVENIFYFVPKYKFLGGYYAPYALVNVANGSLVGDIQGLSLQGGGAGLADANHNLETLTITIARVKGSRSGAQGLDRHRGEPILDEVLALRCWLRERVEDGSRILFPSQKGGAMTRVQCLRLFRRYALAVGVSSDLAHPHILRHSLCSMMAAQHADVYAIQQRAGHKNISNTMIYTHVSDEQASESCREALMTAFAQ